MINYEILHRSTKFYEEAGYKRIESPWLVTDSISNITKPKDAVNYKVTKPGTNKTFVASGEQSFLYLINKGHLPDGNYQTITPCLRNDKFDDTHTKYFIKNELIRIDNKVKLKTLKFDLECIINHAYLFFGLYIDKNDLDIVTIDEVTDIIHKPTNIELGSYGIRSCYFTNWVFGTGVAEPRFSRLLDFIGE